MEGQGHEQAGDFSRRIYPSTVLGIHSKNKLMSLGAQSVLYFGFFLVNSVSCLASEMSMLGIPTEGSLLPAKYPGAHEVISLQPALEEAPVLPIYFLCQRKFKK
jgi:hypothetical protein